MKSTAIWIDTRQARLVLWDGKRITLKTIFSGVERKPKLEGEKSKRTKRGQIGFDYASTQEARFREELKKYLKLIVEMVGDSDNLYLLGPAETKVQLEKEIKGKTGVRSTILKVESCDIMTDNQLIDKVLSFFRKRTKRKPPAPKRRLPPQGVKIDVKPK